MVNSQVMGMSTPPPLASKAASDRDIQSLLIEEWIIVLATQYVDRYEAAVSANRRERVCDGAF